MPGPPDLRTVPDLVLRQLSATSEGVVVLALDGLGAEWAAGSLRRARVRTLRSTFPTTSTTAWLTAVTGADMREHLVVGAEYRIAGSRDGSCGGNAGGEVLLDVAHGRWRNWTASGKCSGHVRSVAYRPVRTLFERAAEMNVPAYALGRELDALDGPWAAALLRGAHRVPATPAPAPALTRTPATPAPAPPDLTVGTVLRQLDELLTAHQRRPLLVWAYVDFDTHLHRFGPDRSLTRALRLLDTAAARWADSGWTVTAHADHGLAPVAHDENAARAWSALDTPHRCRLPSGGAGRVRWLHPHPGTEERFADEARERLAPCADVLAPADLTRSGLLPGSPEVHARLGTVVGVATSAAFPVPDPTYRYEHGAWTPQERDVPLAVWSSDDEGEEP
ncbi:alkaline phosphatase family protein [Streptomyces daliensis]